MEKYLFFFFFLNVHCGISESSRNWDAIITISILTAFCKAWDYFSHKWNRCSAFLSCSCQLKFTTSFRKGMVDFNTPFTFCPTLIIQCIISPVYFSCIAREVYLSIQSSYEILSSFIPFFTSDSHLNTVKYMHYVCET